MKYFSTVDDEMRVLSTVYLSISYLERNENIYIYAWIILFISIKMKNKCLDFKYFLNLFSEWNFMLVWMCQLSFEFIEFDSLNLSIGFIKCHFKNRFSYKFFTLQIIFSQWKCSIYLGIVMNNLSFQTSNPNGKLFSGWYRPLFIASCLTASDGHEYETSFQWNFSSNLTEKPFRMHKTDKINKNFTYCIVSNQ